MTSTADALLAEFCREAAVTRTHLARIPGDRLDWRPHRKSFTIGELGSHLVECLGWADAIFGADEFDFDPRTYRPYRATSTADLLAEFDRLAAAGEEGLRRAAPDAVNQRWRMKVLGRVRVERSRAEALRDFTLSHQIHHRGQLTVYLRLLDIPVPGSYGPTADDAS